MLRVKVSEVAPGTWASGGPYGAGAIGAAAFTGSEALASWKVGALGLPLGNLAHGDTALFAL